MKTPDFSAYTPDQLRAILITCDGQGREIKEKALNMLIDCKVNRSHGYTWDSKAANEGRYSADCS